MKAKNVFYLCLIIAILFFALGGMAYAYVLAIGIGIGLYIGKILFWTFVIGLCALLIYLFTRKSTKKDESGTTN
jgi:hypothetical protein